ncbi:hypothetical protein [Clostridium haemolyticum]|uniref:Uncharacterized protein n=1 Tax=Clostridium haemolyticum NCTC 9693 TaxID=1443114 RepID=A0ABR4TAS8_CLOHA|nr:hypothetical protein [Clostridium haemolyticum]KEI14017.1 hypothetical protein Z960_p0011 [Clostridium haemolyticum NCTC 9693]
MSSINEKLKDYTKVILMSHFQEIIRDNLNLNRGLNGSIITESLIIKASEFEDFRLINLLNKIRYIEDKLTFLEMVERIKNLIPNMRLIQRIDKNTVASEDRLKCYKNFGIICFEDNYFAESKDEIVGQYINNFSNKNLIDALQDYMLSYSILDNISNKKLIDMCYHIIKNIKNTQEILTNDGCIWAFEELIIRDLTDDYKRICNTINRLFIAESRFFNSGKKNDFSTKTDETLYFLASCKAVHTNFKMGLIKNTGRYEEIFKEVFPNFKC